MPVGGLTPLRGNPFNVDTDVHLPAGTGPLMLSDSAGTKETINLMNAAGLAAPGASSVQCDTDVAPLAPRKWTHADHALMSSSCRIQKATIDACDLLSRGGAGEAR